MTRAQKFERLAYLHKFIKNSMKPKVLLVDEIEEALLLAVELLLESETQKGG